MKVQSIKLQDGSMLEIHKDNDATNPREDDNFGTMAFFHSRYKLGDKHGFDNPLEVQLHLDDSQALSLPVYMYDHSGIALSTKPFSCLWDSGQLGVIFVTKEKVVAEFGDFSEANQLKALGLLKTEVEIYNDFLQGDCYGFKAFDAEGNEIDSCWGFIGSDMKTNGLFDQAGVNEKDFKKISD